MNKGASLKDGGWESAVVWLSRRLSLRPDSTPSQRADIQKSQCCDRSREAPRKQLLVRAPQEAKPNMPLASWLQVRRGKKPGLVQQVNKPRTQATRKSQSFTSASQPSEASNALAGFSETMNSLVEKVKARRIPFCCSTRMWAVARYFLEKATII